MQIQDRELVIIGLFLNSCLYITGVFVAGIIMRNGLAWKLSLLTAGLCYVSYALQLADIGKGYSGAAVRLSVVVGVIAGLALLF